MLEFPLNGKTGRSSKAHHPHKGQSVEETDYHTTAYSSLNVWKFLQHLDWVWDGTHSNSGFLRPLIMISLMHKCSYLTRSRDYMRLQGTAPLLLLCHLHSGKDTPTVSSSVGTQDSLSQPSHHTFKNIKHTMRLLTPGGKKVISGVWKQGGRQSFFCVRKKTLLFSYYLCTSYFLLLDLPNKFI